MARRIAFGPFLFDIARGTLTRNGSAIAVGQRGLQVLQALLDAPGETVGKDTLIERAWPGLVVEDSNLTVQISALRKLLGPADDGTEWIVTVPRSGYRFVGEVVIESSASVPLEGAVESGARPSIAVLPFANLSDDASQDYFSDGITEDVIADLTRFRWFSVVGRNASHVYKLRPADTGTVARELAVRYLLRGSVRRGEGRIRISVQLVDAAGGSCLWAEHYDFDATDMLAVQDRIAQQVVAAIEPELLKSEGGFAARRRTGSATGWDLVARGSWHFHHVTRPTHLRARELFRQARTIDPELTEASSWLGRVSAGLVAYGWSDDPRADLDEGMRAALQAVQLDEKSPYAHYALAIVGVYSESFALALRAAEKAVDLSPSFALGHLVMGMAELHAGRAGAGAQALERGLRLNRYDPQNFIWYCFLGLARLFDGRAGAGLDAAVAALQIRPAWRPAAELAAACCTALARHGDASQWHQHADGLPRPAGDALRPLWRRHPAWAERMRELLADVGPAGEAASPR